MSFFFEPFSRLPFTENEKPWQNSQGVYAFSLNSDQRSDQRTSTTSAQSPRRGPSLKALV